MREEKSTSQRTKLIAVSYFVIKEKIVEGEIEVEFTSTVEMAANCHLHY